MWLVFRFQTLTYLSQPGVQVVGGEPDEGRDHGEEEKIVDKNENVIMEG